MAQPAKQAPVFTLEQVRFLEQTFPELTGSSLSFSERLHNAGQRSVLETIKRVSRIRHVPEVY